MTAPLSVRVDSDLDARTWLIANGYEDVARLIDQCIDDWERRQLRTRRNWWLILAGTAEGKPRRVNGVWFPVLKAARRRQGFPPDVGEAIQRGPHELAPPIEKQARWPGTFKRAVK